jgi:hypothetical protein
MGFVNSGDTSVEEKEEECSRSNPMKTIHSPTGNSDHALPLSTNRNRARQQATGKAMSDRWWAERRWWKK